MTRKPTHPIRRMSGRIYRIGARDGFNARKIETSIARHVKPLLDALEEYHNFFCGCDLRDPDVKQTRCRLIASWRAKL